MSDVDLEGLIKNTFKDWCEASSAHAIPNIARSKHVFFKILFLISFLTSTSYCIYSITKSIKKYSQHDTVTSMKIIEEIPTNFPAISLCSLNTLNKVSSKNYIENVLFKNNRTVIDSNVYGDNIFDYFDDLTQILTSSISQYSQNQELRRLLGFELSDMLITCNFNWLNCSSNDFKYFFHPIYGNCFTFNSEEIGVRRVTIPGPDYGLVLEIFLGNPKTHRKYENNAGLILAVHNQTNLPYLNNDRIFVATGSETDVHITRNFISKLSKQYRSESNCLNRGDKPKEISEFFDYILNNNQTYSQQYCYLICLQNQVIKRCNCSIIWLPNYKNYTVCNYDQKDCSTSSVTEILEGKQNLNCTSSCPTECEFIEYKVSTSRATYPTEYYRDLLSTHSIINSSGINIQDIDKAVLRVNVFYETMS